MRGQVPLGLPLGLAHTTARPVFWRLPRRLAGRSPATPTGFSGNRGARKREARRY
jgi:hypothetical protein